MDTKFSNIRNPNLTRIEDLLDVSNTLGTLIDYDILNWNVSNFKWEIIPLIDTINEAVVNNTSSNVECTRFDTVTYTLPTTPVTETIEVWRNGLLLLKDTNYTIDGITIKFDEGTTPEGVIRTTDTITATYINA